MRGGIERYVKTFPKGGFWKGKNYLFDRRMEQIPGTKDVEQVEQEIESRCCMCRQKWTYYRGKFKCSQSLCGVPVIVCTGCDAEALRHPDRLTCELCKEGYRPPEATPDLIGLKRKAESLVLNQQSTQATDDTDMSCKKQKVEHQKIDPKRLFVSKLPLTVSKTKIDEAFGGGNKVKIVHWLTDRKTGAFYGSCIIEMTSTKDVAQISENAKSCAIKLDNKKIKISPVYLKDGEVWPPDDYLGREFPPVGRPNS